MAIGTRRSTMSGTLVARLDSAEVSSAWRLTLSSAQFDSYALSGLTNLTLCRVSCTISHSRTLFAHPPVTRFYSENVNVFFRDEKTSSRRYSSLTSGWLSSATRTTIAQIGCHGTAYRHMRVAITMRERD